MSLWITWVLKIGKRSVLGTCYNTQRVETRYQISCSVVVSWLTLKKQLNPFIGMLLSTTFSILAAGTIIYVFSHRSQASIINHNVVNGISRHIVLLYYCTTTNMQFFVLSINLNLLQARCSSNSPVQGCNQGLLYSMQALLCV